MKLSVSQIQKFRRCQRLYAFEYVEGIKSPPSPKQQFGKGVHSQLERWLKDAIVPDDSPEGQVAKQGIQKGWLPAPSKNLMVEYKFTATWDRDTEMYGFIDCLDIKNGLVIDHKTTSSLNWAKTPEQLALDEQAVVYAACVARLFKLHQVKARWVYYAASNPQDGIRKPCGARPVETVFDVSSQAFRDLVKGLILDTRKMYSIRKCEKEGLALPASPESCEMFGGCPFKDKCGLSGLDRLGAYMEKECMK